MDEFTGFERRFAAALDAYVGPPQPVDTGAVARAAATQPFRRWILPGGLRAIAERRIPWRLFGAVAILAASLGAGAAFIGSNPPKLPSITGLPSAGSVVFERSGDIYIGDLASGEATAIVAGPNDDSSPVFSPDGSLIAFLRGGESSEDMSAVVARSDGSDQRVVVPSGFGERVGIGFAWTPDSASLVVNHDSRPFTTPYWDGELSLFDVSGLTEPRLMTPPLPKGPGGSYLDGGAQFAQMFEPSGAGRILSGGTNALTVWDADLERSDELIPEGLNYGLYSTAGWNVAWSPDGTRISFGVNIGPLTGHQALASYVMDADGTSVTELPIGTWSPNSTMMAFHHCSKDAERPGAQIVVVDSRSGAERALAATAVETKSEGVVPPDYLGDPRPPDIGYCGWFEGPQGRSWDYEGWTWTPDSRGIVFLERTGTKAIAVDIETGQQAPLPWVMDSPPSWQPIVPD